VDGASPVHRPLGRESGIAPGRFFGPTQAYRKDTDIQGMMKMLRYLLLHPDKQQEMGKIGASLVRERYYGIKKLNMRLVDIYESLNNR